MAKILITGSADDLGQLSARSLADQGHQVVLHARNVEHGRYAQYNVPRAEHVITGDLSVIDETKNVADQANVLGRFDAVIHNAGVYQASPKDIFLVNTLAPLYAYLFNPQTQALDLPEFRHASPRACTRGKPHNGRESHQLLIIKVICGDAVYGSRTPLA
jgi:NAD(P)-dependent dehydrogenase (short-subunit alcohol dehydrogenase family)